MACAAGLALCLPDGAGAFSWQFPVAPLQSGPNGSDGADVAVAPDGTTTIVYMRQDNPFSSIRAATRPAGKSEFIYSDVSIPGAGTITQRATYSPRRASSTATRTACTASRTATRAGTYTLVCRLNPAARAQRTKGTLRLRLRTTFTPTGGSARSSVRTVLVHGLSLPVVG